MKKYSILIFIAFVGQQIIAQNKPKNNKAKDSIKTEVIEVITTYAPKVTDAYKIKKKPIIKLSDNVKRKALNYGIKSIPVASTYKPKSGVLKGIDIGDRERLFDNYISLGFGNNTTPFVEGYFHNNSAFEYEYGGKLKFIASSDPVVNTPLSSSYYNASVDLFLKQEMRYFDWKLGFNAFRNKYNWYGLPSNIDFSEAALSNIEDSQTYKYYAINGEIDLPDSSLEKIEGSIGYFADSFESDEINADLKGTFSFPLGRFGLNLDDLELGTSINYLAGGFNRSYSALDKIDYSFAVAGIHPTYLFRAYNFDIKLGAKAYFSLDIENSGNQFFAYPDIEINYPIIPKFANIYVGATGDLQTNSYRSLSNSNPYISPTATIIQTNNVVNGFGGLRGILSGDLNYDLRAGLSITNNMPLFIVNPSKSNGLSTTDTNGFTLKEYEFGNSFNIVYDNIRTINFSGEINYDYSRHLNLGMNVSFNSYNLDTQDHAWNLPELKADIFANYKEKKWYAAANLYFVGNRKGALYNAGTIDSIIDLSSYIDINLNGGYHINDLFSVFLRANNIANNNYQTFTNFNAQGIQVIGGIIWKFDSFFE